MNFYWAKRVNLSIPTKDMQGRMPHFVLGRLQLQQERTLHIITWKEDQNNLLDRIRNTFPGISMKASELNISKGDITLCIQEYRGPNSAYLVTVPVHYTPPSKTG